MHFFIDMQAPEILHMILQSLFNKLLKNISLDFCKILSSKDTPVIEMLVILVKLNKKLLKLIFIIKQLISNCFLLLEEYLGWK